MADFISVPVVAERRVACIASPGPATCLQRFRTPVWESKLRLSSLSYILHGHASGSHWSKKILVSDGVKNCSLLLLIQKLLFHTVQGRLIFYNFMDPSHRLISLYNYPKIVIGEFAPRLSTFLDCIPNNRLWTVSLNSLTILTSLSSGRSANHSVVLVTQISQRTNWSPCSLTVTVI